MDFNFREALASLYRALPLVLLRAGIIASGGFMIIVIFGLLLFAFRPAGGVSRDAAVAITMLAVPGTAAGGLLWRRFFLFRFRVAMLFLFSGSQPSASALAAAMAETRRHFSSYSQWQGLDRWLRRALSAFGMPDAGIPESASSGIPGRSGRLARLLTAGTMRQAVLVLAFSRGGTDIRRSAREGAALYLRHGNESRQLAIRWLRLSAVGLLVLFLCLALPNWFFFSTAGAPVWIGLALAAVIAWVLHRAFIVPFVLAGVSAALLAGTQNKTPDPGLYEKLNL